MITTFLFNVLIALAWAAVTGSFTMINLAFGFALATLVLWIIREQFNTTAYLLRGWRVISLGLLFVEELVLSALWVAGLVVRPRHTLQPGIIAFPLTIDRDMEIALLANLITLTPGTLSVDVSDDKSTLYIHCIDVPDTDALKRSIAEGFERKIMEALR